MRATSLLPLLLLVGCPEPVDSDKQDTGAPVDTAGDTAADSADTADSAGVNTAPGAPEVAITPASPSDTSTLRMTIVTDAVDPEGSPVTYRTVWSVDGAERTDLVGTSVSQTETSDGQVWSVAVYANDGELEGPAGTFSTAAIANQPPVAPTIHIEPSAPASGEDLQLVFDTPASDPNGDLLTQTIQWFEDGVELEALANSASVDGVYVDGGDSFRAVVTVTDGASEALVVEASATVSNAPPVIGRVEVSPTDPLDGDDLECNVTRSDPDGETGALTVSYLWYRDGVAATDVGDTDTVAAGYTEVGESWECEATVSDGLDSVSQLSSAVTIRTPSGYRTTVEVTLTVTEDTAGELTATGEASWDIFSEGSVYATNDCVAVWSLLAEENPNYCRGCDFSFDADYTYDASRSAIVSGCADMAMSSAGNVAFDSAIDAFRAELDDPDYDLSSYYSGGAGLEFRVSGTGGWLRSYYGYTYANYYEVSSSVDTAGNTVIRAWQDVYRYY